MGDFASAAMMRLVKLALEQKGLSHEISPPTKAHISFAYKRSLAEELLAAHGPLLLLQVGETIEQIPTEPVTIALALARDPHDLLARWQKLERFVHSRHRIDIVAQTENAVTLTHQGLAPDAPPTKAEDLLVFGLLIALFRYCGAKGLKARLQADTEWRFQKGQWFEQTYPDNCASWEMTWDRTEGPGLPDAPSSINQNAADRSRVLFSADPCRGWTVAMLAHDLVLSTRSLQRQLKAHEVTFSGLLVTARLNAATQLLLGSHATLAEIGYACGFSDQAHFARGFKKHTGTTPLDFRTRFARE